MFKVIKLQEELLSYIQDYNASQKESDRIKLDSVSLYDLWRLAKVYQPAAKMLFDYARKKTDRLCRQQIESNMQEPLGLIYQNSGESEEDFYKRLQQGFTPWKVKFDFATIFLSHKATASPITQPKSNSLTLDLAFLTQNSSQSVLNETSAWLNLFYLIAIDNEKLAFELFNKPEQRALKRFTERINQASGVYSALALTPAVAQFHAKYNNVFFLMEKNKKRRRLSNTLSSNAKRMRIQDEVSSFEYPALTPNELSVIHKYSGNKTVAEKIERIVTINPIDKQPEPKFKYTWGDSLALKAYSFLHSISFGLLCGTQYALAILKREESLMSTRPENTDILVFDSPQTRYIEPSDSTYSEDEIESTQANLDVQQTITPASPTHPQASPTILISSQQDTLFGTVKNQTDSEPKAPVNYDYADDPEQGTDLDYEEAEQVRTANPHILSAV